MPLERMLRTHFLQQWYAYSDPGMEEALCEVPLLRRFACWLPEAYCAQNLPVTPEQRGLRGKIRGGVGFSGHNVPQQDIFISEQGFPKNCGGKKS